MVLGKLKFTSRQGRQPTLEDGVELLGYVRLQVLAAQGLQARDRNGKSDPYIKFRSGSVRAESEYVKASLSPAWGPLPPSLFTPDKATDKEFIVDFPVYRDTLIFHNVEVVLWDRDKFSKNDYLGELAIGVEKWFNYTDNEDPIVGFNDAGNEPHWHNLSSTRNSKTASGSVLLKFGFVNDPKITAKKGTAAPSTAPPAFNELLVTRYIREIIEEKVTGSRLSRMDRLRTAPATEGVGTLRRNQVPGSVTAPTLELGDSTDSEFDEDDDSSSSFTDAAESVDEDEPEATPIAQVSVPGQVRVVTSGDRDLDDLDASEMTPTASRAPPQFPPINSDLTPKTPTPDTLPSSGTATTKPSPPNRKLGLPAIPNFMRRNSSQKSVPSLAPESTDLESKKTKKRFGLKSGSASSVPSVVPSATPSGGEEEQVQPKKRRQKKRHGHYNLGGDQNDIVGIVFAEINSAAGLPRWKAASQVTFDMDPFCIISFGPKVFRTRVVRHSLNPTWNERLFFHVRRHEMAYAIDLKIYDWDRLSGNDHVADATMPLPLKNAPVPNPDGIYRCNEQGFLCDDNFDNFTLPMVVPTPSEHESTTPAEIVLKAKFTPYAALRQQFWRQYMKQFDADASQTISQIELVAMLDSLGSTLTTQTIEGFFTRFNIDPSGTLTFDQVVICLEAELSKVEHHKRPTQASGTATPAIMELGAPDALQEGPEALDLPSTSSYPSTHFTLDPTAAILDTTAAKGFGTTDDRVPTDPLNGSLDTKAPSKGSERVINIKTCPVCHRPRLNSKSEVDIITHLAICASQDWGSMDGLMVGNFVTSQQAHRKWLGKFVSRVTKGAYQLGADSGNILVQDRLTGQFLEEKMQVYVRLGIRFMYRGMRGGVEGSRIRRMFASMSVKQGAKFDSPDSVSGIAPFIQFHNLDVNEILDPLSSFKTFNEFFYRKLKPDARPLADPTDPKTLVSAADCRMNAFATVSDATRIWVKGKEFSISRLLGEPYKHLAADYEGGAMAIFRLAPQDYHRYHSPVDARVGAIKPINGEYYTVNPMAIRSAVDVYGENKREVVPLDSPVFGRVMFVCIGAMMVASINQTVKEGDEVKRGDEIGYFAFGGSTIVCLFPPGKVQFDDDLLENSSKAIETLVRVGTRIGRNPD